MDRLCYRKLYLFRMSFKWVSANKNKVLKCTYTFSVRCQWLWFACNMCLYFLWEFKLELSSPNILHILLCVLTFREIIYWGMSIVLKYNKLFNLLVHILWGESAMRYNFYYNNNTFFFYIFACFVVFAYLFTRISMFMWLLMHLWLNEII